jgi:hypothetical protein
MMVRLMVMVALASMICGIIEVVLGQECVAGSAKLIAGNWYCQPVKAITYRNFPGTGAYNRIVDMDPISGTCKTDRHGYSGSLAPLNEEVGLSFSLRLSRSCAFRGSSHSNRDEEIVDQNANLI